MQADHAERGIFDESHHRYRDQVRRFYQQEIEPNVGAWEQAGSFDRDVFAKAGAAGILCPAIPEAYGGGGGDILHMAVAYEEHGYSVAGASMDSGLDTDAVGYILMLAGTEAQRRAWIPRFASGELIGEALFTEPQSGSDVSMMQTTAVRSGEGWVVNGSKAWITNGSHLDAGLLVARLEDGGRPRLGLFVVETTAPGVVKGKPYQTMLRGCSSVGELFFQDVIVPDDQLLGGPTAGIGAAVQGLSVARTLYAARAVASCELALSLALDFVKARRGFGGVLFDLQTVRARLAEVKMRIAVARAFVDKCLVSARDGRLTAERASMAKLWCTEMEVQVSDVCAHLHGATGFSNEHPISKIVAAARGHRYAMGVSEMQLETIMRGL